MCERTLCLTLYRLGSFLQENFFRQIRSRSESFGDKNDRGACQEISKMAECFCCLIAEEQTRNFLAFFQFANLLIFKGHLRLDKSSRQKNA